MRRRPVAIAALMLAGFGLSAPGTASASPTAFQYRGVIEGYYGPPFSHADRVDLLGWEAAHGMNLFVSAAKQDPYVRSLWRHQYPAGDLADIVSEIQLASSTGVRWVPDIGPGVPLIPSPNVALPDSDICFSCAADVQALVNRYKPFVTAGSTAIMLSFDDNQKVSTHPEDAVAYGTGDAAYGKMNADLLNKLVTAFPGVTVLTVPADYSGTLTTTYLQAFAAALSPAVVVMWTGTAVVPKTITSADAAAFDAIVGRKVVVWDNYPVNDYAGGIFSTPTNIFEGPLTGREAGLGSQIQGLVANPMAEWQTDKIPLATVADYLNDPAHYDAEASWRRSIAGFGGLDAPFLAKLAENTRSSPLGQSESVVFGPLGTAFNVAYAGAFWPAPADSLRAELLAEQSAPGRLQADGFNPQFMSQAAAFLNRLNVNAGTGLAGLTMLADERPGLTLDVTPAPGGQMTVRGSATPPDPLRAAADQAQLAPLNAQMHADYHNVHGYRFGFDLNGDLFVNQNLMDHFIDQALQDSAAWTPTVPAASASVSLEVDGRPVANPFSITVPAGEVRVVATDGAGGQTGRMASLAGGGGGSSAPAGGLPTGSGLPNTGAGPGWRGGAWWLGIGAILGARMIFRASPRRKGRSDLRFLFRR